MVLLGSIAKVRGKPGVASQKYEPCIAKVRGKIDPACGSMAAANAVSQKYVGRLQYRMAPGHARRRYRKSTNSQPDSAAPERHALGWRCPTIAKVRTGRGVSSRLESRTASRTGRAVSRIRAVMRRVRVPLHASDTCNSTVMKHAREVECVYESCKPAPARL